MAKGSMREALPHAAALVDELRAWLGADLVDQALRNGMALQRGGTGRPGPSMVVRHGEVTVGALPARVAAACPLCGDLHTLSQCKRWKGRR
jgi:hypothetical protein